MEPDPTQFGLTKLIDIADLVEDEGNYKTKAERGALSGLIAGIDEDIRRIFLELPANKLTKVFLQYGQLYGISKVIYAKNTYPRWQSGEIKMSGVVIARLLNLVPLVLDADAVLALVKKVRSMYVRYQIIDLKCHTTDWFRKLPPVVAGLVDYSNQFEFPEAVLEKLKWLTNSSGKAAQDLLAAIEVDEAAVRTLYLNREYIRITRTLTAEGGVSSFNHTIELPQGKINVTITRAPFDLRKFVPLLPSEVGGSRRRLTIICKNPGCGAELETTLKAYRDEPVECASAKITCHRCGLAYVYTDGDLKKTRANLHVEVRKGLWGGHKVHYDCPLCGDRLVSPLSDAGKAESCPNCKSEFIVPNG